MATTNFTPGTLIESSWLNDVDEKTYNDSASIIPYTPTGTIAATNVQAAISEVVSDLAASSGSSLVGYLPAGTGAVATTVQAKLRESVSVLDYLTPEHKIECLTAAAVSDMTYAFNAAQAAADKIEIPTGFFPLDEFKQKHKKVFRGAGLTGTIIKQVNAGRPAWWTVSKAGVYEVQIIGAELTGVWFLGAAGATVSSCIIEGVAPFVVSNSKFHIGGSSGLHTLEIKTGSAFEVYNNDFRVVQQPGVVIADTVGSYGTAVLCGAGVYNHWYLRLVGAANGIGFTCSGFNEVFHDPVTDCQQVWTGQACVINNPTVESWTGTPQTGAIVDLGYNNRFTNITLTSVPNTSVSGYGVVLNNGSATIVTILGYKIYGAYPGSAPLRPIQVGPLNSGLIADAETSACQDKLEVYCTYGQLKNFTFSGDCYSLTNMAKKLPADIVFVTAATYTLDANFATTGQLDETIYLNSSANCTITLPAATSFVGRRVYVCSRVAFSLVSASANILPMTGGGTPNILAATVGKWAILQASSAGIWNIIASN